MQGQATTARGGRNAASVPLSKRRQELRGSPWRSGARPARNRATGVYPPATARRRRCSWWTDNTGGCSGYPPFFNMVVSNGASASATFTLSGYLINVP
jgi:hypothetical protein